MFYDFIYLAKGFQMRPKERSTLTDVLRRKTCSRDSGELPPPVSTMSTASKVKYHQNIATEKIMTHTSI